MLFKLEAPGDWGVMQSTPQITTTTEQLAMADGCKLFLRSWHTGSKEMLLIVHGLGAHSGWFIDMGNALAAQGLNVYALDHRGFGRSEGLPGHVEKYGTYVADLAAVVSEICARHPEGKLFLLGHSMGAIFTTYLAAQQPGLVDGILFLNPWVKDSVKAPLSLTLGVFGGGLRKSRKLWRTPGGTEGMTTNPEAAKMLDSDPYWRRDLTANFLLQIFLMRQGMLKVAREILQPVVVLQSEEDKSVISKASRQLFDALSSADKTWTTYPGYAHDAELEPDRSTLDRDIVAWINKHAL